MTNPGALRDVSFGTLLTGLGSGLAFALTTLWVREASLLLGLPFLYSAAWVLLCVIATQTLMLLAWLLLREPYTLIVLWQRPKLVFAISLFSCIGSLGWFTAMSLETVALVKTLGQIEVLFTLMISRDAGLIDPAVSRCSSVCKGRGHRLTMPPENHAC
jgi:drug/metabolite transporter (DMT)-like permease